MKNIWVAGDFYNVKYRTGYMTRHGGMTVFEEQHADTFHGGAGHVLNNVIEICKNTQIRVNPAQYGLWQPPWELERWIADTNVLNQWVRIDSNPSEFRHFAKMKKIQTRYKDSQYHCLVISTRNLGFNTSDMSDLPEINLLVVDDRYRHFGMNSEPSIGLGKTTVLHCHGLEYETNYARKFDWVIHTNDNGYVNIVHGGVTTSVALPEIEVVNRTGARETFTATLASYLTYNSFKSDDVDTMLDAVEIAINAAQQVCIVEMYDTTTFQLEVNN